jgi:hypothetical protein
MECEQRVIIKFLFNKGADARQMAERLRAQSPTRIMITTDRVISLPLEGSIGESQQNSGLPVGG